MNAALVLSPRPPTRAGLLDRAYLTFPDTDAGRAAAEEHVALSRGTLTVYRCVLDGEWWRVVE